LAFAMSPPAKAGSVLVDRERRPVRIAGMPRIEQQDIPVASQGLAVTSVAEVVDTRPVASLANGGRGSLVGRVGDAKAGPVSGDSLAEGLSVGRQLSVCWGATNTGTGTLALLQEREIGILA